MAAGENIDLPDSSVPLSICSKMRDACRILLVTTKVAHMRTTKGKDLESGIQDPAKPFCLNIQHIIASASKSSLNTLITQFSNPANLHQFEFHIGGTLSLVILTFPFCISCRVRF